MNRLAGVTNRSCSPAFKTPASKLDGHLPFGKMMAIVEQSPAAEPAGSCRRTLDKLPQDAGMTGQDGHGHGREQVNSH